ncbi:MAG: hypothetical protein E7260_06080 [Lachnospiraceae bacterium]|nr:hypothetical protein [Lachnospiraceae bacterium]
MSEVNGVAKQETIRKYSERSERLKKTNKNVLVSMTIIEGFLLFVFVLQLITAVNLKPLVIIPPIIMLLVAIPANWITYVKDHASEKFRIVAMCAFMLIYLWLNISGGAIYVVMYALPTLYCLILYSDKKFSKITGFLGIGIMLVRLIRGFVVLGGGGLGDEIPVIMMGIMAFAYFLISATAHKDFEDDMMLKMQDDAAVQKNMLDDILEVVEVAEAEIKDVAELMAHVSNSNEVMNQSLQEIAAGSLSTAESIQEQTIMTENISSAIELTDENATTMAEVAENSAKQAEESTRRMEEMQKQSEQIETSGAELASSMQQLKEKVAAVTGITQVIFSISSQTNLLALNASIESARAGEAGRGFAVVADQIRQLAEQTKQSTEQIASITAELTAEADNAASLVEKSVGATTEQKNLIVQNAVAFDEVRTQSQTASGKARELDEEVSRLKEANNKIVESIAQLSAVSEEVTANSQQASELSDDNVRQMNEAAEKIEAVKERIVGLAKYQEMLK